LNAFMVICESSGCGRWKSCVDGCKYSDLQEKGKGSYEY
jgi:hypothetical protein